MRNAACAVRLPLRVCSIHSLPCSTVNSMILHVAVMPLQLVMDTPEFGESLRQRRFHRRLVGAGFLARGFGDFLRRADAGNHVLALGVDEKFAVELFLAGRRIARESDPGSRGVAHIAEHHSLHIDRSAPTRRNIVQAPIGDGARVHPRTEHRADRAPQLLMGVLRERLTGLFLDTGFVLRDELFQIVGVEIGIERIAVAVLELVEDFLERTMLKTEHHVGIHGDKAAVAIQGKAAVAGFFRQRLHRYVVQSEIKHGVHHAGHRRAGAGAHRNQQADFCRRRISWP